MSATVGNPEDLLGWLQGSLDRPGQVINPEVPGTAVVPELRVDRVESLEQAATLLSKLHQGEKRLVFVDSRARAEKLAVALGDRNVDVYLSHSSLSATERRRSEEAFATATNCIIVATSTLELGIDIGDLDRVIQIGSQSSVSSFLQRLGRTGRRAETTRNCLFISLDDQELLQTLGMLNAWADGFVEPVVPPVLPLHLVAQQILAACLSEGALPRSTWHERWTASTLMSRSSLGRQADEVLEYLLSAGMLNEDGPYVFIGEAAEKAFGRRHFMELLSAFTSPPLFTVLAGRAEIGTVESHTLTTSVEGPRVLALAGRSWKVTDINWSRRQVRVEATDLSGIARWGMSSGGVGAALAKGMRDVLLGKDPGGVLLSSRASDALANLRASGRSLVSNHGLIFVEASNSNSLEPEWWTWAGRPRNQQLIAWLGDSLARQSQSARHDRIRLQRPLDRKAVAERISEIEGLPKDKRPLPKVDDRALEGLKFFEALPEQWAREVVAARLVQE
ncbi:helicase-related protein [Corynebacterium sp. J010B-136]|uniref:helicase-related protein n=1 Tax=Corynebacterium sp. J010B-136 TaxID=2099401 RepID=UPI0035126C39